MADFRLDIKGLDKRLNDLAKLPKELKERIEGEIEASVQDINSAQVNQAPIDTGRLRQATYYSKLGELSYGLFSAVEYAPYIEFGTGGLVNVPADLEDYARQFKGAGIKEVNLPARPYFFTPFFAEKNELLNRIKKILG